MPEVIDSVRWPFYQYNILMPEYIEADIFVWLYLSLIIMQNEQGGLPKNSYEKEEKLAVETIMKEKFFNVIDKITLKKIIAYAERDYVVRDETNLINKRKELDDKTFEFVETFSSLFSDKLQIQKVYMDAITGNVVPIFDALPYIKDCKDENIARLTKLIDDKPSANTVKSAYSHYKELSKTEKSEMEVNGKGIDTILNIKEPRESDFNIIFLEDKGTLFNFEVKIEIDDNEIKVSTPFGQDNVKNITYMWMQTCFKEARSVCKELDEKIKEIETQYLYDNKIINKENSTIFNISVSDQLPVCGNIYRLLETVKMNNVETINKAKKILISIDNYYTEQSKYYFLEIGSFLECLISVLVEHKDMMKRKLTTEHVFRTAIKSACSRVKVDYSLMMGYEIFYNWEKGRVNFKSDMADIVYSNIHFLRCPSLYWDFVNDAFSLYNLRNQQAAHYHSDNDFRNAIDKLQIDKLYNITKVFLDLNQGGTI
ncbi:MAG: hypothetical protein LBM77_04660 [Spirochaetaceae bacterium]|jgi:hypothetical protein|nr:hypothetical protein [Spirochaetaceae bacterium]